MGKEINDKTTKIGGFKIVPPPKDPYKRKLIQEDNFGELGNGHAGIGTRKAMREKEKLR